MLASLWQSSCCRVAVWCSVSFLVVPWVYLSEGCDCGIFLSCSLILLTFYFLSSENHHSKCVSWDVPIVARKCMLAG